MWLVRPPYRSSPLYAATWGGMVLSTGLWWNRGLYVDAMGDQEPVVDPNAPVYVYVQVADMIERDIRSGRLPAGARLPGEQDLAEQYGIARGTARSVVRELRDRGLATTLPSKGTYIVEPPAADS